MPETWEGWLTLVLVILVVMFLAFKIKPVAAIVAPDVTLKAA